MQREIKLPGPLLDAQGHLREAGYAKSLLLSYDRKAIRANPLRIKEWDYYLVTNGRYALALLQGGGCFGLYAPGAARLHP